MSLAPTVQIAHPATGGGYLYDLAVLRHLIEQRLDPLFRGIAPPAGARILLYNETDAGLGDVAFATKLMRHLRSFAPSLSITLVSSDPDKQRTFGLPDGVTLWEVGDFAASAPDEARRPTLVVSAPGIFDHCRIRQQAYELLGLEDDVPFLYLAEYGSLRQLKDDALKPHMSRIAALRERYLDEVAAAAGLEPDDMGHSGKTGAVVTVVGEEVRTIDHLGRALTAERPDNPVYSWLTAPALAARSCGLEAGELGIHIEEPLRDAARDAGIGGRAPERLDELQDGIFAVELLGGALGQAVYPEEAGLYAGYSYEGLDTFISFVAVLEEGRDRRIDVVIPNRGSAERVATTFFDDPTRARLAAAGISRVEIVGNAAEEGPQRAALDRRTLSVADEGKVLRLITRYPLPHADMRTLLRASEPATLVSGDQSFSEAVSAGKAILYLEPVYCQTFHLDAALALAGQVAPAVREILDFGMQFKWDDARWPRIRELLQRQELYDDYRRFDEAIWQSHDANRPLVDVILRALWTLEDDNLRTSVVALLRHTWSSWSVEEGVTVRGLDLGKVAAAVAGLSQHA